MGVGGEVKEDVEERKRAELCVTFADNVKRVVCLKCRASGVHVVEHLGVDPRLRVG